MRYWWVNQNQTYRHEVAGGYLWSPKRNANGARNPFYESMREVAPSQTRLPRSIFPAFETASSSCPVRPRRRGDVAREPHV